ncbi:MAG TPA: flavodoxin domain-containing protein [Coriobacteriia bacterium]|nr:flavodoxin domain-containing protein [Coriobacteriia bacterium]
MSRALVTYATKYGSTREVAEAIASTLTESGIETDVLHAKDVTDVAPYSAVIVGGPLYYFHWNRDARHLLSHHHKALAYKPVAVFAVGPMEDTEEQFESARGQLDKALAKFEWLKPKAVTVFGGKFDPTGLRFPDNNPGMKNMPASDIRDWDAIREWAAGLPELLGLRIPQQATTR